MTLKHIDFYDSSVMRELERHAVNSGNISAPTVNEIVKKASVSKAYSPTGDLFIDLIKLAEGLRNKGFTKDAEILEVKIFAYKKAAEEYNSELASAHPEGDVTMGEASNGLGDVETLESAHSKMVEVVNKKPTGKQAALIASILSASGEVLDIKKKAQDASNEETAEDIFSGRTAARAAIIKEINSFLTVQFPKIAGILKSHDLDLSKWIFRYEDLYNGTPTFRALYASRAGVDPAAIEKFFQDNERLYGKNFTGDEQGRISSILQTYAQAQDVNKLVAYANIVPGGLGTKYLMGSLPDPDKRQYVAENPDKANDPIFIDNPNSVWQWHSWAGALFSKRTADNFTLNESKLLGVAREIQNAHYNDFQALFSEEKLVAATAKLQEELKTIITPWNEVIAFFENVPELPPNAMSTASLTMAINAQIDKLRPYVEGGAISKKLLALAAIWMPGWVPNMLAKAVEAINEIAATVSFLNSKPLSPGDAIVQDPSKAVALLMGTAKMYWDARKQVDPKSSTAKEYAQNQRVTFDLAKAIKDGAGKPYIAIYETIKNIFPNATTYEKLVQEAQNWMQESSGVTGVPANEYIATQAASSLIPGIKKLAQGLIRKKPSGPTVPAGGPPGDSTSVAKPASGRTTTGLAKANMNDPKEAAVALMQQYLAYFAEALASENAKSKFKNYNPQDVTLIIRTGPKANPAVNTYDGKWGTETQAALDLANKYIRQLGIDALDTKARYANKVTSADAESVAKKNASILSQATQMLGGKAGAIGQAGVGAVYDRLPDNIDWNVVEYPLVEHRIPVTTQNMSSLAALYDFVIKNNWAEPKYSKDAQGFDVEGLTAGNMLFIIRWFQRRAQFVYNSSIRTDKAAAALARQYYDAAKKLEGQLAAFLSARGGITQETSGSIMDIEALREYSSSVAGPVGRREQRGPRGEAIPAGSEYQYARLRQQSGVGEGTDWKSPTGKEEGPPIGPDGTINLASRWFHGMDEKLGISHNPLLNPEMFRRYSAADLAKTFYASAGGNMDQQARQQALVATGLEVEGYDQGAGDYIVSYFDPITRRKTRTYAMRVPAYQRAYKARLTAGPMRSFGALLQSISASLAPAIAEWMRVTQPNDAAKQAEQAWHTEWQRILGLRANEAATQ